MYFCDSNQLEKLSIHNWHIYIHLYILGSISILLLEKMDNIFTAKIVDLYCKCTCDIFKIFEIAKKIILIPNNLRPYFGALFENNDYDLATNIYKNETHIVIVLSILTAIFFSFK